MFDVSWVDPARETVGERTYRKDTEKQRSGRHHNNETRDRNKTPREASLRSLISSNATAKASQWETPPPKSPVSKCIQSRSYVQQSLHDTTYNKQFSAASIQSDSSALGWSKDSDLLEYLHSEAQRNASTENSRPSTILGHTNISDPIETDLASCAESIWSGSSVTDSLAPCSRTSSFVVQPLSPGSFISRSIDVTVGPRDSIENGKYLGTSVVSISAGGSPQCRDQEEPSELEHPQCSAKKSPPSLAFDPSFLPSLEDSPRRDKPRLLELSHSPLKRDLSLAPRDILQPMSIGSSSNPRLIQSSAQSTTQPTSRGHPLDRSPGISQTWEAPEAWGCSTRSPESSKSPVVPVFCTDRPLLHNSPSHPQQLTGGNSGWDSSSMTTEFQHIRRTMRLMQAASEKIMLERLREDWTGTVDAILKHELEMHKHMWMVTAMRHFDRLDSSESWRGGLEGDGEKTTCGVNGRTKEKLDKILSLFDNYASVCYLAATIPPETELHHVSTTPLSPNQFPNIMSLFDPTGSPYLTYASNMFSSIYSFGSASLLSSYAIPILLRECHRVLALPSSRAQNLTTGGERSSIDEYDAVDSVVHRGGILHLTIVDPCPVSATLGPRLRDWLDYHLVFDLERQFRCLHPVRLFPGWLAEAGLYAEGSTTTQITFLASIANSQSLASSESGKRGDAAEQMAEKEMEKETKEEEQSREDDVTQELKSVLGRLLWKETWGPTVQLKGGKWWWEDNSILDECWARGTLWEYAVIEAVKG